MPNKINNGLELSKQSWGALRQNKQLIIFPIISMIVIIIITALFFIPEALILGSTSSTGEAGTSESDFQWLIFMVLLFIYYLVAYIFTIFSNTALVGATMKLINGEQATVGDGIAVALSRFGKIFVYALISATVGVIARSISQSGRNSDNFIVAILAAIVGGLIQGAWNLLVFFAIPVMVVENLPVGASLKRSLEIFKQTWGESFVGSTAVGGISCLVNLVVLIVTGAMIAAGIALEFLPLAILGGILMILGFVIVGLLNGAVNGIFQASLYQFAKTGNAGPFIDTELAREAFS
jgi:hypothetical protein